MSIRVPVHPAVLAWARARSGVDDATWPMRFPKFDAWMGGEAPTLKQLQDFAKKTHTPIGSFFCDTPPLETIPIADFRTVGDRPIGGSTGTSADLLDVIYACQRRQEWYAEHQLLQGEPELEFVGSSKVSESTASIATQMRELLGWTSTARARCSNSDAVLTTLRERAEASGVLVMISGIVGSNTSRKLNPAEFRGFALVDRHASIVFVNGADAKAAQIFTFAHEFAHLWLGESGVSDVDPASVRNSSTERWCNQVAAEFLVPMAEFRALLDSGSVWRSQLSALAEHFRVSTHVILGRLREASVLSWDEYFEALATERARIGALVSGSGGGGNYYNTKPVQMSKRFTSALISSVKEGSTPYTRAFRLLDVKKESTFDGLAERLGIA